MNVCCVVGGVEDSGFSLEVMKYVVGLCRGCGESCVF